MPFQNLRKILTKPVADPAIVKMYAACVAQARQPAFYRDLGVPDTVDGRFDLLLLHAFLVMHRLKDATETKQQLFDLMFADMDRSLREMGVGDMSIGKKMKPMLAAFYGRVQNYDKALIEGDEALVETLQRNLYGAAPPAREIATKLAAYVVAAISALEKQHDNDLLSGQVAFPDPLLK